MINYVNFKLSKDVEKNPGPTQYNNDNHGVIIRPFMQNYCSTMQLTSPISRVRTGPGKPGKSRNFIMAFSRTGKSWKNGTQSWKVLEIC